MNISANILITGSNGFIGKHLLNSLMHICIGYIICFDRGAINIFKNDALIQKLSTNEIDILDGFLNNNKIDFVYHLATNYKTDHKHDQVKDLILDNVYFTANVCEFVVEHKPTFINSCSYWQFEPMGYELRPNNLYAASKNAALAVLEHYRVSHDFKIINR